MGPPWELSALGGTSPLQCNKEAASSNHLGLTLGLTPCGEKIFIIETM